MVSYCGFYDKKLCIVRSKSKAKFQLVKCDILRYRRRLEIADRVMSGSWITGTSIHIYHPEPSRKVYEGEPPISFKGLEAIFHFGQSCLLSTYHTRIQQNNESRHAMYESKHSSLKQSIKPRSHLIVEIGFRLPPRPRY